MIFQKAHLQFKTSRKTIDCVLGFTEETIKIDSVFAKHDFSEIWDGWLACGILDFTSKPLFYFVLTQLGRWFDETPFSTMILIKTTL
jgi:hypothetical protein